MSDQNKRPAKLDLDLTAEEFQDYDGQLAVSGSDFDFSQLISPASLRGLAAIVVSLLVKNYETLLTVDSIPFINLASP